MLRELPIGGWGQRGTWHGKVATSSFSDYRIVIICCPTCASDSSLDGYSVGEEDGIVTPIFYCPYHCGSRMSLKLLGYGDWVKSLPKPAPEQLKPQDDLLNSSGDSSNYS